MDNITLRKKYREYMRKGKTKEALKILKQIWKLYEVEQPKPQPAITITTSMEPVKESPEDKMLDNYLAQNARTVIKALKEDNLDKDVLSKLLKLEEQGKRRRSIISTIRKLMRS